MLSFKEILGFGEGAMEDEELDQNLEYTEQVPDTGAEQETSSGIFNRRSAPRKERSSVQMGGVTNVNVVLVKPDKYDSATSIADDLNAHKAVVLNLENASKETSRRLVDFLSGVAYANGGDIQRVATNTFLITPPNVNLTNGQDEGDFDTATYL